MQCNLYTIQTYMYHCSYYTLLTSQTCCTLCVGACVDMVTAGGFDTASRQSLQSIVG